MKAKLRYIPSLLILLPLINSFFGSIFIFEEGEINLFLSFSLGYLALFYIFYFVLKKIFKSQNYLKILYITSWIGFVFLNYRSWTTFYGYRIQGWVTQINNYSFLIWLTVLFFGVLVIIFIYDKYFFQLFLSIWVVLLISSPVSIFLANYFSQDIQTNTPKTENNLEEVVFVEKPDIYFFLYDGLASLETLENFYGFDTKNLKSILGDNNFYIANNAISSYGITSMSLNTIFSTNYAVEDGENYKTNNRHILREFNIVNSQVIRTLESNGYDIAAYSKEFNCEDSLNENIVCLGRKNSKQIFYELLIRTPFQIIENNQQSIPFYFEILDFLGLNCGENCGDLKIQSIMEIFHNKLNHNEDRKPVFYFIHLKNTHGPFYVDAKCNSLKQISYNSSAFEMSKPYIDSIKCLEKELTGFLDSIDENSIVILQSDHGPHYNYARNYEQLTDEEILSRYRIFSSIKLPKECNQTLSQDYGQINTFLQVFNCLSNESIDNKKVKSFYVPVDPRFNEVVEITNRFNY